MVIVMTSELVLARVDASTCPPSVHLCPPMASKVDTQKPIILLREEPVCPPCLPINHKRVFLGSIQWSREQAVKWVDKVDRWTNGLFVNILSSLSLSTFTSKVDKVDTLSTDQHQLRNRANWHKSLTP